MKRDIRSMLIRAGIAVGVIALVAAGAQMDVFRGERTSAEGEATQVEQEPSGTETGASEVDATTVEAPAPPFALGQALLTVADLPAGWTLEQRGRQEARDLLCSTELALAAGAAESPKVFFSKAPDGDYLAQGILAYAEGGAAGTLDRLRGLLDGCTEWTTEQGGTSQTWSVSTVDVTGLGDDAVAVRLTGTVGDLELETTQVFIRRGDILNSVAYGGTEGTTQRIRPIAETADAKVAQALAG